MTYKEFKATVWKTKDAPQVMAMAAPSEARQRIDAKRAEINAKLAEQLAPKTN